MDNVPNMPIRKATAKQRKDVPPLGTTLVTYRGHFNDTGVLAVAWSPNGQYIASAGGDKTVQVWDATSGETLFTYHAHTKGVEAIVWSPDEQRIAPGSDDDTVHVWRAIA